jgi:CO/xanthine dehydrogenase Mo-binding subunit
MAKKRGTGMAAVSYPIGMHLGGDPTGALVHATSSGNFIVALASVDVGQGLKTVMAQIAAEALGVPLDTVIIDTGDTDTGPHCSGTGASRTTHRAGNAVVAAAREARAAMLDVASEILEVSAADLDTDGKGNIHVKGVAEKSVSVMDTVLAATFQFGRTIAGRSMYLVPKSPQDPETGESDPHSTQAHACTVAEVEVDTETGEVAVLSLKSAYEIGRQINPELVKGQIVGGAWMGIGHTLCETTAPYYPSTRHAPLDFLNYGMTGVAEMPEVECELLEFPSESGPYGAKGVGEMVANSPIPAIVNAINNALDLDISDIPVTPEVILRALDEQAGAAAAD